MIHWMSLSFLLLIPSFVYPHGTEVHCDMCHFDGLDDADCKDYGLINNDTLIAWNVASEACMDEFNIQISTPDVSGICFSANAFVTALRFESSLNTAKQGMGVAEGGFFDESGNLLNNITVSGQSINCEANENDCFNAMKTYFESDTNGQKEMQDVCDTLQNAVMKDRQLEQSTIRNRLCQESRDGSVIPDACNDLWVQLEEKMQEYNDTNCAFFAMGTQNRTIPGCEEDEDHHDDEEASKSSSCLPLHFLFSTAVTSFVMLLV